MRRWLGLLVLACGLLAAAGLASAQAEPESVQAEPEGWAYALANELMSPYCPGRTLAECPSSQAETLRVWLIVQEASGRSRAEVEAELVERFGERILPAPPARGFGLAAYALPALLFLAGGGIWWGFMRGQTRKPAASPPPASAPAAPLDPELERIVDRDLSA